MNAEFVECQICGKKMKWIQNKHLSQHGITTKEYKKMFPNHPNKTSDMQKKIEETRWGEYETIHPKIKKCFREGCEEKVAEKSKYCSYSCRATDRANSDANPFKNTKTNPAFKTGSSSSWKRQRKIRAEMDNHSCVRCGKTGLDGKAHKYSVHHIIPKRCFTLDNLDDRDDVFNTITLCGICHKEVESSSFWLLVRLLIEKGVSREEITEYLRNEIETNAPFEAFITKSTEE